MDILKHSLWPAALLATLAAASAPSFSQNAAEPVRAAEPARHVFVPDADRLAAFRDQPAFRYDRAPATSENIIQRIRRQITEWIAAVFNNRVADAFWRVFPYLLLVGAVAGLIFLLIGNTPSGIFRKSRGKALDIEEAHEDVHAIDFEREIDRAASEGRFRDALRLMYLQVLKRLTDAGHIRWRPEKTNREYLLELEDTGLRTDFSRLTRIFEYVWYGDFRIDRAGFEQIREAFRAASSRIPAS